MRDSIAVHIPCSSKKMGIEESFMKVGGGGLAGWLRGSGRLKGCVLRGAGDATQRPPGLPLPAHRGPLTPCLPSLLDSPSLPPQVASMCAGNVVNTNVPCCGMAGDRGMRYPELTAASLQVRVCWGQ